MKIPVKAVLFRVLTATNWSTLTGNQRGQYDLRLTSDPDFGTFFDVPGDPAVGTWPRDIEIQPFDGSDPIPARVIPYDYYGAAGARGDYRFPKQKYNLPSAYPLWNPERVATLTTAFSQIEGATVIVVRDVNDNFHARWLSAEAVERLPEPLRSRIKNKKAGVFEVEATAGGTSDLTRVVIAALRQHHNVLLYGPPGTGKTFTVNEVKAGFDALVIDTEAEEDPLEGGSGTHTLWTTFHQSYSYEDFIVGLRPKPLESGGFALEAVAGTLLELSEWARVPGRRSLLIIDEINRGNVSRVFGELITLLEVDKRLGADAKPLPTTVSVRLPYVSPDDPVTVSLPDGTTADVPNPFTLPRDVYVLATMNSVDTSVAPLDAALRRRFTMVQLTPDLAGMQPMFNLPEADELAIPDFELKTREDVCALALQVLARLNAGIAMFLGSEFALGQWYLRPLVATLNRDEAALALAEIWEKSLLPQLIEYFAGRSEQLLSVLREPASFSALRVSRPSSDWEFLGASAHLEARNEAATNDVLALLLHIAGIEAPASE